MESPRVYIDSNVVIRLMESRDAKVMSAFKDVADRGGIVCTSEMTLAEVLVMPLRESDETLAGAYEAFLSTGGGVEMLPVTREVLRQSAGLRATYGYKTPDAIHVASALALDCKVLVSSDKRLGMPKHLIRFDPDDQFTLGALL